MPYTHPLPGHWVARGLFAGLFFAVAGILGGCARPAPPALKVAPADVIVAYPVLREVTDIEDFTGRTEPYKYLEVRSRVSGELMKIHFADGRHVDKNDLLFEIDDRVYKAQYDGAKARLEQAQAQILLAKAQLRKAKVLFDNAEAAKRQKANPEEDFLTKEADYQGARASVNAAEGAEASAKADLTVADQNLNWTKITAPYAGRISRRQVDPGNLIVATVSGSNGSSGMVSGTTSGTMLTTLVVLDPIYIGFDIDERTLENRREGIRAGKIPTSSEGTLLVDVGLGHQTGYPYKARVTFSDNQLDAGTGTLHIRAEMDNPSLKDGLPAVVGWAAYVDAERKGLRLLSPGMFVRVRLPMGQPHKALTIPEEAIVTDQGQRFVYVVNEKDEADYRQIVLGPLNGGLRAIEDGIKVGERVIVSGQQRVRKNGKVKARFATPDSPANSTPTK